MRFLCIILFSLPFGLYCQYGPTQSILNSNWHQLRERSTLLHDLNGDGNIDLLYSYENHLNCRFGISGGSFEEQAIELAGPYTRLEFDEDGLADIDQDGNLELLFKWDFGSNFTLSWFNFDAAGNVTSVVDHSDSGHLIFEAYLYDFEIVDMDDDGDLDILSYYKTDGYYDSGPTFYIQEEDVRVLWYEDPASSNTSHHLFAIGSVTNGELDPVTGYPIYTNWLHNDIREIRYIDANNDGLKDIVMQINWSGGYSDSFGDSFADGSATLLSLNLGGNSFQDFMNMEQRELPSYGYCEFRDFNGDNELDLIHDNTISGAIEHYESFAFGGAQLNPDQTISNVIPNNSFAFLNHKYSYFNDFDFDGDTDIISYDDEHIRLHLNENGVFSTDSILYNLESYYEEATILTTDLNGDNQTDLVASFFDQGEHAVFMNQPTEFLRERILSSFYFEGERLTSADIDGNGLKDYLIQTTDDKLIWSSISADGEVLDTNFIDSGVSEISRHFWLDINGDQIDDLLLTNDEGIYALTSDGSGNFESPQLIHSQFARFYRILHPSDVDGDGDLDIICNQDMGSGIPVFWLENINNDFNTSHTIQTNLGNFGNDHIAIADFDNNGFDDVLFHFPLAITCYFNNGSGTFTDYILPQSGLYEHIKPFDYNSDGFQDLILLDENADVLSFIPNMQNSTFGTEEEIISQFNGKNFLVVDMDNDTDPDIISINNNLSHSRFYLNNGINEFNEPVSLQSNTIGIISDQDHNNDGFFDLVRMGENGIKIREFEGDEIKTISGRVFLDENENGQWDPGEPPFPPASVYFSPDNFTQHITLFGTYARFYNDLGEHDVSSLNDPSIWNLTTGIPIYELELSAAEPNIDSVDFGFAPNGVQNIVEGSILIPNWLCGGPSTGAVSAFNAGNTVPNGYLAYTLDDAISIIDASEADSISGNTVYFSYSDVYYYESQSFGVELLFPGVDFIDSTLTYTLEVFDDAGMLIDVVTQQEIVGCAYDPNDKNEFTGYTENGFVLNGSELEYTIRFQNTGTDTAHTVVLEDILDFHLDRNSLYVIDNSHPYELVIDENDKAIFTFSEIFLPDSNVNEPASHGYISYRISLKDENYAAGEIIENTCSIFFDFNPPIITNTTLNTIFNCDGLASIESALEVCSEAFFQVSATQAFIEEYAWTIDGLDFGNDSLAFLNLDDAGTYTIHLSASNPICSVNDSIQITVLETPLANAGSDLEFCGLNGTLNAEDNGFNGSWSGPSEITFNSINDNQSEISSSGQGAFTLFWTNINGICSSSDSVNVSFFEIPWVEIAQVDEVLYANTFGNNYQWYLDGDSIPGANGESFTPTQNGIYTVSVEGQNECLGFSEPFNYIIDSIDELEDFQIIISPNPMQDFAWIEIHSSNKNDLILELISPEGKLIRTEHLSTNIFKLERENLIAGMYLFNLKTADGQMLRTKKLLIK